MHTYQFHFFNPAKYRYLVLVINNYIVCDIGRRTAASGKLIPTY